MDYLSGRKIGLAEIEPTFFVTGSDFQRNVVMDGPGPVFLRYSTDLK